MDNLSAGLDLTPKLEHLEGLNDVYISFEATVPLLTNGTEHLKLPHFNGNKSLPIHRWFTYKEGFSSELLNWVCEITETRIDSISRMLDPFVGVATSLLSAQLQYTGIGDLTLVGIERNPFTAFVARTKLNWDNFDVGRIEALIPALAAEVSNRNGQTFQVSDLSTLHNERAFDEDALQDLIFARETIKLGLKNDDDASFFMLGWASIIETVSKVRKDGRALRFVNKEHRPIVSIILESKWSQMLEDIRQTKIAVGRLKRGNILTEIHEGDGRTLDSLGDDCAPFDLILYSPPYLNNLDYTEVYKMELWLSEAVNSNAEFRELRRKTMRSHPSIKFAETDHVDNLPVNSWPRKLRDAILEVVPADHYREQRNRTIRGYMDDMLIALASQYCHIRDGGFVVCVVGNSLHGNKNHPIPVATDLLIASLAEQVGFDVVKIQATRHTNRRKHVASASRESAIVLQRPKTSGC
jgi:hypothetical protein